MFYFVPGVPLVKMERFAGVDAKTWLPHPVLSKGEGGGGNEYIIII